MSAEGDLRVRYRFGPLERRGMVAGWRGGQIVTIGSGLVVAVLVVRVTSSAIGAIAALFVVGGSVAAATWPLGGRTIEEWAPHAVRHAAATRQKSRVRTDPFATLRVLPVEIESAATSPAAVVVDERTRTYCAVLHASASGFVLLGEEEKVQRVNAWAAVLSSMARDGSALHRVQWVARNARAPGAYAGGELPSGVEGDTPAGRSYAALLKSHGEICRRQEVLIALSIRPGRAVRSAKRAGERHVGECAVLLREAGALRRRLLDSGIDATSLLGPETLERAIRDAFARGPKSAPRPAQACEIVPATWSGASAAAGVSWSDEAHADPYADPGAVRFERRVRNWPWPMGLRAEWGRVQVDGTWHVTYWVSEWPRSDVGPDFLGPLLLMPEATTTVSVVMEPLGPLQAARRIEQARTADIADSELRRRGGFLATARRRREEETLAQREGELADGHAAYRFSGYVTVSADDPDELEEAGGRAEQAAARCGLELRVCYGDQAAAFCSTLPLCRGLS